ncbi:MAG: AAA family ATPase [Planctomycetota bacterium]
MSDPESTRLIGLLRRVLRDTQQLYQRSSKWLVKRHPTLIKCAAADFERFMDDMHRGLLVKVYATVARADRVWTGAEKRVAAVLIEHLWSEDLSGTELREAAKEIFAQAEKLAWPALVDPFVRYEPLAERRADVETVVMRFAQLVAKCDGETSHVEAETLHQMQHDLDAVLYPVPSSTPSQNNEGEFAGESARRFAYSESSAHRHPEPSPSEKASTLTDDERASMLDNAMKELAELIGLAKVKERVRSTTNYLRLQQQRQEKGLSTMPISLHMQFVGNPGTGKTTVARIVGQILGAIGCLSRGHVVETDRSGLVAEYAGQTAVKTNRLIDSAIGGVLFIDEAYSLVDASGDDAYGREAIQTLLKRMEDDRECLAVILAGYGDEMTTMIESNPGLKSRVGTRIEFDDYSPPELGNIFELLCRKNDYRLGAAARHRLLLGMTQLHEDRDRHFGNGRLVRNSFEESVRKLADRIANAPNLTEELLTALTPDDIRVPGLSDDHLCELGQRKHRLRIHCEACSKAASIRPTSLGGRVRCPGCDQTIKTGWATVRWGSGATA